DGNDSDFHSLHITGTDPDEIRLRPRATSFFGIRRIELLDLCAQIPASVHRALLPPSRIVCSSSGRSARPKSRTSPAVKPHHAERRAEFPRVSSGFRPYWQPPPVGLQTQPWRGAPGCLGCGHSVNADSCSRSFAFAVTC